MSLHLTAEGKIIKIFESERVTINGKERDQRALMLIVAQRRGSFVEVIVSLLDADCLLADSLRVDDRIRASGPAFLTSRGKLRFDARTIEAKAGGTWRQILGARKTEPGRRRNRARHTQR